jgi:hypothetical protein
VPVTNREGVVKSSVVRILLSNIAERYKLSLNITNQMRIVCNHSTVTDGHGLTEKQSEKIKEKGIVKK